ncbi:MAG TPA: hypothetical protein VGN97_12185 [Mesorhizobium sp.]|jgi:hypothetical protein|nr:hypothetical protein [Mesorhizobium sp.]
MSRLPPHVPARLERAERYESFGGPFRAEAARLRSLTDEQFEDEAWGAYEGSLKAAQDRSSAFCLRGERRPRPFP